MNEWITETWSTVQWNMIQPHKGMKHRDEAWKHYAKCKKASQKTTYSEVLLYEKPRIGKSREKERLMMS